ncbi:hypothetical protein AKO1_005340 [Acrasis kona]|uniref:Uncharacterized protein n=1 Tax=Acrasis kona TaxID=1008807 RepID=A0AAW2YM57_9EUKA
MCPPSQFYTEDLFEPKCLRYFLQESTVLEIIMDTDAPTTYVQSYLSNLTMRTPSLDKSLCMILDVPSDIKELQQKEAPILPKSIKIDVKSTTLLLPWRRFANNHLQHCSEYNST